MINKNVVTKNTKLVAMRVPHEILKLVEDEENKSAALIELLIIGAKEKYGVELTIAHKKTAGEAA